ncbi:MAG: AmmeMemoRadiSam system protein B [Desulfotalea sp.]|nr:MAG: AmmeMemoRadiSam system protein B [Desulfotalea sp.]
MRDPVVAGRFYPADKNKLKAAVVDYFKQPEQKTPVEAFAIIAPHAGYVYSGGLAAKTINSVCIPETVLLLGPNHTGQGSPASLSQQDWSTPLGEVTTNSELIRLISQQNKNIVIDETAHTLEHSLEVQLPFLQVLQDMLTIVPLTLGQLSYARCEEIAESLYRSISAYHSTVLILASTDMNHFESRSVSQAKDKLALNAIEAMDPCTLYTTVQKNNISMCGVIPVVITLLLCLKMGARTATLVDYMDSGDISLDTKQVVGYAGVIIQ